MAGDNYPDGLADEEDGDSQFLDTLQSLKNRNSLHLEKLSSLYAAYSSQAGLDDGAISRFFSATPSRHPDTELQSPANTVVKTRRSFNTSGVTVPKPFEMSVREAEKREKVRAQAWTDPEDDIKEEDIECCKQFRAQPVPAQVLLPLYNDIMEQKDERRKNDRQKRKEQLIAMQKPFNFVIDERKKSYEPQVPAPTQKSQHVIKAIPKSVLDPSVSDRLKEAELLRKINGQLRAKEMLQSSSAPVPLTRHIRDPDSRTSQRCKEEHLDFLQQSLSFQPRTNSAMPDFTLLHRNFQKLALSRQSVREPTKVKPFNLRTSQQPLRKDTIHTQHQQDEERQPVTSSRNLFSLSHNTLPVYITDSTKRREASIRSSLQDREHHHAEKSQWLQKHRQRSMAMQRSISRRARALDSHQPLAEINTQKLKDNRASDWRRSQEYKKELQQMKKRVGNRAFLFEQVKKGSAVKKAEHKFSHTLREVGLTEDFVHQKGNTEETLLDTYEHQSAEDL